MGIIDTLHRSKKELLKPSEKSYWKYSLEVKLVNISQIRKKAKLMQSERRALLHELSDKEPIDQVVIIDNSNKRLGKLTSYQMKEILSDMGFNVDPWFSKKNFADFEAVMNIGGYTIPSWVRLVRIFSKILPSREHLLLSKLSPGKDRLHLRVFENNDGTWTIASHTDFNWLSLNLPRIYKAHVGHGGGDYITGTIMFYHLISKFEQALHKNKTFLIKDIQEVINRSYSESLENKIKTSLSL